MAKYYFTENTFNYHFDQVLQGNFPSNSNFPSLKFPSPQLSGGDTPTHTVHTSWVKTQYSGKSAMASSTPKDSSQKQIKYQVGVKDFSKLNLSVLSRSQLLIPKQKLWPPTHETLDSTKLWWVFHSRILQKKKSWKKEGKILDFLFSSFSIFVQRPSSYSCTYFF